MQRISDALFALAPEIQALLLGTVITLIVHLLRPRAKVIWGRMHGWSFLFREKDGEVHQIYVATWIVTNQGRATANCVDVTFLQKPGNFNVWPARRFDIRSNPNDTFTITIQELGPREFLGIETQSLNAADEITSATFGGRTAKNLRYWPQIAAPRWLVGMTLGLMFLGLCVVAYWTVRLGVELWLLVR